MDDCDLSKPEDTVPSIEDDTSELAFGPPLQSLHKERCSLRTALRVKAAELERLLDSEINTCRNFSLRPVDDREAHRNARLRR